MGVQGALGHEASTAAGESSGGRARFQMHGAWRRAVRIVRADEEATETARAEEGAGDEGLRRSPPVRIDAADAAEGIPVGAPAGTASSRGLTRAKTIRRFGPTGGGVAGERGARMARSAGPGPRRARSAGEGTVGAAGAPGRVGIMGATARAGGHPRPEGRNRGARAATAGVGRGLREKGTRVVADEAATPTEQSTTPPRVCRGKNAIQVQGKPVRAVMTLHPRWPEEEAPSPQTTRAIDAPVAARQREPEPANTRGSVTSRYDSFFAVSIHSYFAADQPDVMRGGDGGEEALSHRHVPRDDDRDICQGGLSRVRITPPIRKVNPLSLLIGCGSQRGAPGHGALASQRGRGW